MKSVHLLTIVLALGLVSSCTGLSNAAQAQPWPTEMLPTIAALTLEAQGIFLSTPAATISAGKILASPTPTSPATSSPTKTWTTTPSVAQTATAMSNAQPTTVQSPTTTLEPSAAPTINDSAALPINTPSPLIPEARIQIYWLGELSKVTSPINILARLTSHTGEVVRVELYGEDGRLLARQVKIFYTIPWSVAGLDMDLDFEISAAAELGRLVISVEDVYGRLVDLNSINLILLSSGQTELNPTNALRQRIYIQEPVDKALILGGVLLVSGQARPDTDQPLRVAIIDESGRILGQRLAGVNIITPGGYGSFAAEVPYSVHELTPALVLVYEEGGLISDKSHLASVEVLLSP